MMASGPAAGAPAAASGSEAVSRRQAAFFDAAPARRRSNPVMRLWRRARGGMYDLMDGAGIWADVFGRQRDWMGDLAGRNVLDLGCYEGNVLSPYLAANAGRYLGIDLSARALERLARRFDEAGLHQARLRCVDVLSDEFTEGGFDVIYAQGVLHHFNPIETVLPVLRAKLAPGGRIITCDPLRTSLLTRGVRAIYQPFRADRAWEWPFTRATFEAIRAEFRVAAFQGFLGASKWAIPFAGAHRPSALRLARRLHARDLRLATAEGPHLWRCLQVALCLEAP